MIKVVQVKKVKLSADDFVDALNDYLTRRYAVKLTDDESEDLIELIDENIDLAYGLEVVDSQQETCCVENFTTSKIESFIENIQSICSDAAADDTTYAIKYSMSNEFSRQDVFNLLNRILSERNKPLLGLDTVDRGNFIKIDKNDIITVVPVANWRYDHFYIVDYLSKQLPRR